MKIIVFDAGPIISLTTNNLLGLLTSLKEKYKGSFYLSEGIKRELIEIPLSTKKFKFEALQVLRSINFHVLEVYNNEEMRKKAIHLLDTANKCFMAKGNYMQIVHFAEMSGLATVLINNAEAFVVDERSTRLLIEDPDRLRSILEDRLHTKIIVNKNKLNEFRNMCKGVKLIRSVELVTIAYELGLLDKYIVNIPEPRRTLLEAVLWGVKLNGCTVSEREIEDIIKIELKK